MSNEIDDKELDDYLSGDTQYSRRYRAIEVDAVPASLDKLVLQHASIQGASSSAPARRTKSLSYWMRMSAPVALAASFVLVVSIVMESGQYQLPQVARQENAASPVSATQAPPTQANVEEKQREPASSAMQPTMGDKNPAANQLTASNKQDKPEANASSKQLPTPSSTRSTSQSTAGTGATKVELTTAETEVAKTELNRALAAAPTHQVVEKDAAPSTAAKEEISAPAQTQMTAAAPVVLRSDSTNNSASDVRETKQKQSDRATALEEVVITGSYNSGKNQHKDPRIEMKEREADPEAWLTYIRDLRATNLANKANREWQRFIKAYPDYPVDEADTARRKK